MSNRYFHQDLCDILAEIEENGVSAVIRDAIAGGYRWRNDHDMRISYAMDYHLAQVIENSGYCNRLFLWQCYVRLFREFYGTARS